MKLITLGCLWLYYPALLVTGFVGKSVPPAIGWETLNDVRFRKGYNVEVNEFFLYPRFGPTVRALQGKPIAITGYVIPVDAGGSLYVVSRYPMAQCFFCGGAGPESIVQLNFRSNSSRRFRTDETRCFTGTLRLNADNINELNYILENATPCSN